MSSLANPSSSWADDDAYDPSLPRQTSSATEPSASQMKEGAVGASPPHGMAPAAGSGVDVPDSGVDGKAAEITAGVDDGMHAEDGKEFGKRVTDVDAETDRMARLFLGVEDDSQKKQRLRIVQANPNSHLSSAKTFDDMGLPESLLRGIQRMGFEKPSAIQEMALPLCLRSPPENLLAQAQSGSGKTAAFCLAGLARVDTRLAMPQLIIVTPTRELAVQCVQETLIPMSHFMDPPLKIFSLLRGVRPPVTGIREHVVVGTPGSMLQALRRHVLIFQHVAVFVLDEADAMLENVSGPGSSHRENCENIKRFLPPQQAQMLLFSATFPKHVKAFGLAIAESPVNEITLPNEKDLVLDVITQLWIDLRHARQTRLQLLQELYDVLEMGQSIIFCRLKADSDSISRTLNEQGFRCSNLHGNLEGLDRDRCMDEFRQGHNKVLITTNVLARGVDIPAVSLVINYDMPTLGRTEQPDPATYLHRIGRTGRFGRRGVAINLIADEASFMVLESIDRHFSPGESMVREAPTDVEELEKIIIEESKKRVAVLDPLIA